MKRFIFAYLTLVSILCVQAQDTLIAKDVAFWDIVPKNAKVVRAATGFKFTEGPVWNVRGNYLLFSDIPANIIYRLMLEKTYNEFKNPSENSNGLTYDYKGNLVVCEQKTKRIVRISKVDGKSVVLADKFNGKTFNSPNDIVCRKDSSFYFTDPPYGHMQYNGDKQSELSFTGVYFVKNGKVSLVDSSLKRANGICLSPDEKTLYVAQSEFRWLWKSYKLDEAGKVISSKIFYEGADITGNPDGIKVDVQGNVYCTGNNGVVIFTKEGKLLGTIKIPENTSNLAWGDPDLQTLFVTAQTSVYKIRLNIKGHIAYEGVK